jgi:hypothetical protein
MTEAEWLACTGPEKMLGSLYGKAPSRKMRLAAVGCCRQVAHLLPADERCRLALEVAESYADRQASRKELAQAHAAAEAAFKSTHSWGTCRGMAAVLAAHAVQWASQPTMRRYPDAAASNARNALVWDALPPAAAPGPEVFGESSNHEAVEAAAGAAQAILLRDIFGNPFHPVAVNPAWQTPQVVALAQAAYDQRELPAGTLDTARLPVLADALEEVGCTDQTILDHLRGLGPHVRGCWVVDLLLGKS